MPESLGTPNGEPRIAERGSSFQLIIPKLQQTIDSLGVNPLGKKLLLFQEDLTIETSSNTFELGSQRFLFKGRIYPHGIEEAPFVGKELTAAIRVLILPNQAEFRGQGYGSKIVTAWEELLQEQGVNTFAALGVKQTDQVKNFWRKLGYQDPPKDADISLGYTMYKQLG